MAENTSDDAESAEKTESKSAAEGDDQAAKDQPASPPAPRRQVQLSLRALAIGAVIVILAVALGAMTWLYLGERSTAQRQQRAADDQARAEQISLEYAVGAATMNYQDLNTWKGELTEGTSPELKEKLTKAADSMQQLLIPLEWNSTSEPLVAKVRSEDNGVYVVDTFVSVLTKTTQAPDNLQSTATYSITIDSNNDWLITDVGGIGAVAGAK